MAVMTMDKKFTSMRPAFMQFVQAIPLMCLEVHNQINNMQITKSDIGRMVTLNWDKVGQIDALLISADGFTKSGKAFLPSGGSIVDVTAKQVIAKHDYTSA